MPTIEIDPQGSEMAYAEYGDKLGFPILAQHGLIASIKDFALFDLLIQNGARIVCIARPGYGESSPYPMKNIGQWGDLVGILVAELGLTQFDVLGMSSGAPYSYASAHTFPEKARNIYIFSGIPAMYEDAILKHWPFEVKKNASIEEMQKLAHGLFFSNPAAEDLARNDTRDSMANNAFGIAQDFRLRCMDWGFKLEEVKQQVFIRHARFDPGIPLVTAEMTARMLPNSQLQVEETDVHFSEDSLDLFFERTILPHL